MEFENLKNSELQEKLKAAKTIEELFELAKSEGVDLSDEQLQSVSGGSWSFCTNDCTDCPDDEYDPNNWS